MFDVGFWELLVIGVIALVVVGPERLPGMMRTAGLWVGRARAAFYSIRDEVEREVNAQGLRDTERAIRENVQTTIDDTRSTVERSFEDDNESAYVDGQRTDDAKAEQPAGGDAQTAGTGEGSGEEREQTDSAEERKKVPDEGGQ
jgi:sec-independent protein translocase protein TatB